MIYSGKSDFIRAKNLSSEKSGCTWANWLYWDKTGCIRAKVIVFVKK